MNAVPFSATVRPYYFAWNLHAFSGIDRGTGRGKRAVILKGYKMGGWIIIFIVLAVLMAWLGFYTLAGVAQTIAIVLFFVLLALIVLGGIRAAISGRTP
jgi:uncharacterized membrane protein YtjA (UPF0391 family)